MNPWIVEPLPQPGGGDERSAHAARTFRHRAGKPVTIALCVRLDATLDFVADRVSLVLLGEGPHDHGDSSGEVGTKCQYASSEANRQAISTVSILLWLEPRARE